MGDLTLDETEQHMFRHSASGYGVEVTGGTPSDRERALREYLDEPFVTVDGRTCTSYNDVLTRLVARAREESVTDDERISAITVTRALVEADTNVLFLEFDALPTETQTDVAQMTKGLAERREFEGQIGFSSRNGGRVVRAEPDLSMRVRTWDVNEDDA